MKESPHRSLTEMRAMLTFVIGVVARQESISGPGSFDVSIYEVKSQDLHEVFEEPRYLKT
jgi:hypothetical protein